MAKGIENLWKGKKVIILGDIMLDEYVQVDVARISPEGFLPVLNKKNTHYNLGGAANVALNLKNLGIHPTLLGLVSDDVSGTKIKEILEKHNIEDTHLLSDSNRPTTTKTRFMVGNNQILRLDEEKNITITKDTEALVLDKIKRIIDGSRIDAIIFQDYNKGFLTPFLIAETIKIATEKCILSLVDPKENNFFAYRNVSLFKPNLKEIRAKIPLGINPDKQEDLLRADTDLREKLRHHITMITLSEKGIFISDKNQNHNSPSLRKNIIDVCGAGDTVLSIATAALIAKMNLEDLTKLCNIGAGQVCCKKGVQAVVLEELLEEYRRNP